MQGSGVHMLVCAVRVAKTMTGSPAAPLMRQRQRVALMVCPDGGNRVAGVLQICLLRHHAWRLQTVQAIACTAAAPSGSTNQLSPHALCRLLSAANRQYIVAVLTFVCSPSQSWPRS